MKSGILLIDKPPGVTSHDATHAISRKLGVRAGHTGTLDSFATGLLIVCLGRATRASEYLTPLPKEYLLVAALGRATDTYDSTGKTVASSPVVPDRTMIEEVAAGLTGRMSQTPPPYSAKKVRGRRASDYARAGTHVGLAPARVEIFEFKVTGYDYPNVGLIVRCSSGTYVRSLVKDLGERLGCGAFTLELRRTRIGEFSVEDSTALDEVLKGPGNFSLTPLMEALYFFPAVTLPREESRLFSSGGKAAFPAPGVPGDRFRVLDEGGVFLGVGREEGGWIAPEKIFLLDSSA